MSHSADLTPEGVTLNRNLFLKGYSKVPVQADFIKKAELRGGPTHLMLQRGGGKAGYFASTDEVHNIVALGTGFLKEPIDDVERASILLHESFHLSLKTKEEVPVFTEHFKNSCQLGWTWQKYGTPVGIPGTDQKYGTFLRTSNIEQARAVANGAATGVKTINDIPPTVRKLNDEIVKMIETPCP